MKLLNIGLIRYVIIMLGLILVSMFCFYMASTENVIENDEPLDISKATVEQISENKFIDVKITSTVCQLNKEKTFNYAIKANFGINSIQEAKQCIVPYKIVNNVTCLSWVYILTAIVSLITAIFITILLVRKLKANENYINVMPNNSCSLSENTHNSYSNDEYYTGYNQQDDVDSQANNNQNDIHRF